MVAGTSGRGREWRHPRISGNHFTHNNKVDRDRKAINNDSCCRSGDCSSCYSSCGSGGTMTMVADTNSYSSSTRATTLKCTHLPFSSTSFNRQSTISSSATLSDNNNNIYVNNTRKMCDTRHLSESMDGRVPTSTLSSPSSTSSITSSSQISSCSSPRRCLPHTSRCFSTTASQQYFKALVLVMVLMFTSLPLQALGIGEY